LSNIDLRNRLAGFHPQEFQSFCIKTSQTLRLLPPQSHDCSCYVIRPIPVPPPLWLQKHTDLLAHDFAHSPGLWHQPRLACVTCTWS